MSMCDVCCYAIFQDNYGHRQMCSECCSNIRDIANAHGQGEAIRQVREAALRYLDVWLTTKTVVDTLTAWFPDLFESSQNGCEIKGYVPMCLDRIAGVLTLATRFVMD